MNFEVSIDADETSRFLRAVYSEQLPFATSRTINRVALSFQGAQRTYQRSIFDVKRPDFVDRAVKIKPFSNKRSLEARVLIDPPGGAKRASVLTKFEEQHEKRPFRGEFIAVPTDNVPRRSGVIPREWRPSRLRLKMHGRRFTPGKAIVLTGAKNTVAFIRRGIGGMIFERDGDELLPMYQLVHSVPITPDLHFGENAQRTVRQQWDSAFALSFHEAIATAR